jgi:hypothetical protein
LNRGHVSRSSDSFGRYRHVTVTLLLRAAAQAHEVVLNVKEDPMRNIVSRQSFAGAIVASAVFAAFSAGHAAQLQHDTIRSAYVTLESLDQSGFGDAIAFTPSGYTPPGIVDPVSQPLASQVQPGFGAAIAFVASDYTPPGIVNLVRQPLASQNQAGFGSEITFIAGGYTPPGIADPSTIKVVVAR